MNYLDITINKKQYIMRNEFSKIIEIDQTGKKSIFDNIKSLPGDLQKIIEDAIELKENPDEYFYYNPVKYSPSEIEISEYIQNDKIKNVVIPEYINGKKVVVLGKMFDSEKTVERIIIPETVESLSEFFCVMSTSIKSVHLSSKITSLPHSCFQSCYNLENINLENIKFIDDECFGNNYNLNNIKLNNLEYIGKYGFCWCANLTSISAQNLKFIGACAFSSCKLLHSVNFSKNLDYIGHSAFEKCYKLEKITLPNTLTKILRSTFLECINLKTINIPEKLTKIEPKAFKNSALTGELTFPKTLKRIDSEAFSGCNLGRINMSKETMYDSTAFSLNQLLSIKLYDSTKEKIKSFFSLNKER